MRIHDFLRRIGWSASYREERVDAPAAASRVAAAVRSLRAEPCGVGLSERLAVFVAFTPLEALLSFLTASHEGLLAAVVTPRTLGDFLAACDNAAAVHCILPEGRATPGALAERELVRVPWSAASTNQVDDTEPSSAETLRQKPSGPAPQAARFVFCTSGTTGLPKRIVYDEERLVANAAVVSDYLGLGSRDRSLCAFPITYMYGLSTTLCALQSNSHIDYVEFADARLMAIEAERRDATVLPILGDWSVPLGQQWAQRRFRSDRLTILNASDRITVPQLDLLRPSCGSLWNNFGQTESGPRLFALDLTKITCFDRYEHEGAVAPGYPVHPDIHTRVTEANAQGVGPLLYRTPFAMSGLLRHDLSVQPAPDWIASGDHFQRDWDGLHKWSGRTAHTLKINGQLVSLRAVADGLLAITNVIGVGYAKSLTGALCLFIETTDDEVLSGRTGAVRNLVELLLPALPCSLRFVTRLPRTETGKVDARALANILIEETV